MAMTCNDAFDLLSEKLAGDLDAFRLAAVDEHLAGCPACRQELLELASLLGSLTEGGAEPLALVGDPGPRYWDNFAGRVRTTIAARREAERARKGIFAWFTVSRLAVAVSVLLIAMVAWRGEIPLLSGSVDEEDPLLASLVPSDPGMVQDALAEMSSDEQSRFEQTLLADGLKDTRKPSAAPTAASTPASKAAASATPAKHDSKSTIDPTDGLSGGSDDLSDLDDLTPEQLDQLLRSLNAMKT